jgi:hypothetical protein
LIQDSGLFLLLALVLAKSLAMRFLIALLKLYVEVLQHCSLLPSRLQPILAQVFLLSFPIPPFLLQSVLSLGPPQLLELFVRVTEVPGRH